MAKLIPGIKVIRHNAGGIDFPDDPSYPYKLEVSLRPPEFLSVTFVLMHGGSEEIVVRGMTREALEEFVELYKFREHPRLRELTITGPDDNQSET